MNFCGRLICGLILSCICFGVTGSSKELSVTQSPSSIIVNEGESTQISCCWSKIEHKVKVSWYINVTKLSDVQQKLQEHETQNCSILILTNILKNATGHYVCEVIQDIPVLNKVKANGTALSVSDSQIEMTTTVGIHTLFNPAVEKTDVLDHPKTKPEDENNNYLDQGSSREVVIIYIFRSLPFICLLVAFFYLNRDDKQVTTSRPAVWTLILTAPIHSNKSIAVEHAVEVGGVDEDLEAGETRRNETEEAKQGEKVSEQEKERVNDEKPKVTAVTEEEKDEEKQTVVIVNTEQGTSPMHDNENKTVSVLDTDEKTHVIAGIEEGTVSVMGDLVSAL